jgi:hypothetical protein
MPGTTDIAWAVNDEASAEVTAEYELAFRNLLAGLPVNYKDAGLFVMARTGKLSGYTVEADDEDRLKQLPRQL